MRLTTLSRKLPWQILWVLGITSLCWISWVEVDATASDILPERHFEACDASSDVCSNSNAYKSNHKSVGNSCRLYMAPTTLQDIEGNYGIFTAVDLPAGATVLANDGPSIPGWVDYRKWPSERFPDTDHFGLFNNVWWGTQGSVSDQLRAEFDVGDHMSGYIFDLQINFGALPNCHPYRSNIICMQPSDGIDYDDQTYLSGEHAKNPLRGSFSYYTGKHFSVTEPVKAGMELFLDYGTDWEQHGIPREQDYYSAAALVRKWILGVDKKKVDHDKITGRNVTEPSRILSIDDLINGTKALLKLIRVASPESPLDNLGYDSSYHDFEDETVNSGIYELEQLTSRVLSLIPQTNEEWDKIYHQSWKVLDDRKQKIDEPYEKTSIDIPSIKDVSDAMHHVSKPPPKSLLELEETGICLDHIVAGKSQAKLELDKDGNSSEMTVGRGAIAARFLGKGEIVVPVPLLHLLDRSLIEKDPKETMSFTELLLNYCFGHSQSTMVMCPLTNVVLVNHCSDRNGRFLCGNGGKGPNAEYRWALDSDWDTKTKTTLTMTMDDLGDTNHQQQHRMISMEIVAKRDIQEGEEIFIDYGERWEEAWLEHVRDWQNDDENTNTRWSSPLTLYELNHGSNFVDKDSTQSEDSFFYGDLRSNEVALSDDGRFVAMCWYEGTLDIALSLGARHRKWDPNSDRGDGNQTSSIFWKDLSDDEIYREYAVDVGQKRSVEYQHLRDYHPGWFGHFWPCSIISKNGREKDDDDNDDNDDNDDDEDRYVVRIFPSDYHFHTFGDAFYIDTAVHLLLKNFPRSSIRFVTVPYNGDQYNPKAFRHHIEIKDELFPEQWKNKL